jgi:hypothetical protein
LPGAIHEVTAKRISLGLPGAIHEVTAKRISLGRNQGIKNYLYCPSGYDNPVNSSGNLPDDPPDRPAKDLNRGMPDS